MHDNVRFHLDGVESQFAIDLHNVSTVTASEKSLAFTESNTLCAVSGVEL